MVEQSRRASRVVSPQAGPGEVDTSTPLGINRRMSAGTTRAVGRRLAAIGDQLEREWTRRRTNRLPTPLQLLGPAQMLAMTISRDIHSQLWGVQGLSAAVKAWIWNTAAGQGVLRVETLTTWASGLKPETLAGWSRGVLVTAALVAAVNILCTLWAEPKEP